MRSGRSRLLARHRDSEARTIPKEGWMKRHWTKRHWITNVYLGLALLPACQVQSPTGTDVVAQDMSKFCGVPVPTAGGWDGKPLPPTGATEMYLIYQDLAKPGDWLAFRVDYGAGKLPSAVRFPTASFGKFMESFDPATTYTVVRPPVPPPPPGGELGPVILEEGLLAVNMQVQAQQSGVCE
jgi:hypothetical protein